MAAAAVGGLCRACPAPREPGFSKERRLEPQITIGLLTRQDGFPLTVSAFEGWIETRTGWSIRKFVKTARRYRTIETQAGEDVITAADPLSDDLRRALDAISHAS
jgi:hypothetical protein